MTKGQRTHTGPKPTSAHKQKREATKKIMKDNLDKEVNLRPLLRARYAASTLKVYDCKIETLKHIFIEVFELDPNCDAPITDARFIRWLAACFEARSISGSTVEGYRAAISAYWKQERLEGPCWADEKEIKDLVNTFRYVTERERPARGTLTEEMANRFMVTIEEDYGQLIADILTIQLHMGLRISQVLLLRVGDMQPDAVETNVVYLRANKAQTRERPGITRVHDKLCDSMAVAAYNRLSAGKRHGDMLHDATAEELREICKLTAIKLKFPDELVYDGTHVLRHAGTSLIVKNAWQLFCEQLTRMSPSTLQRYNATLHNRRR
jgi:integrase